MSERKYCAKLTREMLEGYGFIEPLWINDEWVIRREWYKSGRYRKDKIIKTIAITEVVGKHKYTKPKVYYKITFSYDGKTVSIPVARFIYAWFKGEAPEGYDIDHIINDPKDNRLENLEIATREENLAKRFRDNPNNNCNQYTALKKNNIKYFYNETDSGIKEICFYDANKYNEVTAFGNELYIIDDYGLDSRDINAIIEDIKNNYFKYNE